MARRTRSGSFMALASVLAASVVVVFPGPGFAASCSRSGCNGLDPAATGCQDSAVTLGEFTSGRQRVELRYSTSCLASWTRVTTRDTGGYCNANNSFGQLRTYRSDGSLINVRYKQTVCPSGVRYTAMQNNSGGNTAQACLDESPTGTPDPYECTARH